MTQSRFDLSTGRGRLRAYWDMVMVDHGLFRMAWTNFHRVSPALARSNHPMPWRVGRLARRGFKTVVNLRGRNDSGWYHLEAEACRRHGVELVDFPVKSRDTPSRETIHAAKRLFETLRYPAVIHCKSGADRAGLMGALYRLLHENRPVEEALEQLSWRYGHIKQAKVGMIDFFFERYRRDAAQHPIPFLEWVDRVYDPAEVKASFMSQWWANLLVDKILRRE